jgi:murein DD-endopeptidase MepM/ murein hydrolase activator NlpD
MVEKQDRSFDRWTTYVGHRGIDHPVPVGTPIRAAGPGRIYSQFKTDKGGFHRYVLYDNGIMRGYFHLRDFNGPPLNARVNYGDIICYSGNTGHSTGPHLHDEAEYPQGSVKRPPEYWNYVNQAPGEYVGGPGVAGGGALAINERRVGANGANGRNDPSTSGPVTQTLVPGDVGRFDAWKNGQVVDGNPVWFHGAISGDWFWSGGFTSQSTAGLTDLNAVAIGPMQRRNTNEANGRELPTSDSFLNQTLPAGTLGDFDGWTRGQMVEDEDRWIRGAHSGDWFWLKAFEPRNVDNLPEIAATPSPPSSVNYTFEAFGPSVTEVIPANWMNFENPISVPDAPDGTNKRVGFPADQTDVVLHDFGKHREDTYQGTIAWFQNPAASTSSHFVVSGPHRTQMVSLADRAWHAGPKGNWWIGIEIDPVVGYTGTDPAILEHKRQTIESVNILLADLRRYYNKEKFVYHEHNEIMATSCGDDIHFEDYPQVIVVPEPEPEPTEPTLKEQIAETYRELGDLLEQLPEGG